MFNKSRYIIWIETYERYSSLPGQHQAKDFNRG